MGKESKALNGQRSTYGFPLSTDTFCHPKCQSAISNVAARCAEGEEFSDGKIWSAENTLVDKRASVNNAIGPDSCNYQATGPTADRTFVPTVAPTAAPTFPRNISFNLSANISANTTQFEDAISGAAPKTIMLFFVRVWLTLVITA